MTPEEVRKSNQEWKFGYLKSLAITREMKLKALFASKEEFLSYGDEDKFSYLVEHIFELSLFKDKEVINFLESIGVEEIVYHYFVDANEIFVELDRFYEKSIYLYPYEFIWMYYEALSRLFFFKQLAVQFKIDLNKEFNKLSRKEKNGTLLQTEEQDLDKLKRLDQKIKQEKIDLRILIKKEIVSTSIKKIFNLPHKVTLYNFFITFKEFNLASPIDKKGMTSFYCDFYDLMAILLRDKTILNDDPNTDIRLNYETEERFKAKRVKSLLKLKGYGEYE